MIELRERLADFSGTVDDTVVLPFELRQRSRLRTMTRAGRDAGVLLEPGSTLRGGDLLRSVCGLVVKVIAEPEVLMEVRNADPFTLARLAYHLGNRHVQVQIGDGWLRTPEDPVLRAMLEQLGAETTRVTAPFDAESGAYGGHHRHAMAPPLEEKFRYLPKLHLFEPDP
ncbi:MAG TPA: urease accessory protein UreE [Porticoccaceae bacterium]|nr:urease accessory protein UreE [Porticoccaceae bacterium]